jgi:hypothetical protein
VDATLKLIQGTERSTPQHCGATMEDQCQKSQRMTLRLLVKEWVQYVTKGAVVFGNISQSLRSFTMK